MSLNSDIRKGNSAANSNSGRREATYNNNSRTANYNVNVNSTDSNTAREIERTIRSLAFSL
ncbi:putative phage tail tape measure domain protein [Clostridioides difficile CD9]|uniref:hypothetical protein n=1 Tax=Clostridioides difficile TaxID=1496 RepID=UPI00038D6555|nr:hypothetical protein [Clostridioides difficile]EQE02540.1 putative phage tail tape measure domain protein [Clostridioides difficile CD9]EQG39386.1 putative phage tail tape measure domain protein [Clostridioides difficile DA00129]